MRMLVATGVMGFTPTPDVSLQRSGETARVCASPTADSLSMSA